MYMRGNRQTDRLSLQYSFVSLMDYLYVGDETWKGLSHSSYLRYRYLPFCMNIEPQPCLLSCRCGKEGERFSLFYGIEHV